MRAATNSNWSENDTITSPEDDFNKLSWAEQADKLTSQIEEAKDRADALPIMKVATQLGFTEEYRPYKWRPGKGKKGEKGIRIIKAFYDKPQPSEGYKWPRNDFKYSLRQKIQGEREALDGLLWEKYGE